MSNKIDCVTLWSGTDNGTSSTLNLSETVNNFKYLVIYFHDDQNFKGSLKAFMNNTGGQGCLFMNKCGANGDILYITSRRFNVSGQTFTKDKEVVVTQQGTSISVTASTNYLRVERIIGYRS